MQALSQLSYGPNSYATSRREVTAISRLVFLRDAVANDVGDVRIAFFFILLDEGGVVHALVFLHLDVVGIGDVGGLAFLALRFGIGVLKRDEVRALFPL